ncbi:PEP-CTERM sorting domain-containing protein [Pseudoduganella umbonata]|nr:PEP-CTERM sorting domain-containing protein [Pseudoduganella umbonata]
MSAEGAALSGLDGYGTYNTVSYASQPSNTFTLSANTAVTFSVLADMRASTTMGYNLDADMGEYASVQAMLNVGGLLNGMYVSDPQERRVVAAFDVLDDNTTTGVSDSWSGLLSTSFVNTGATEASGELQAFIIVDGYSSVWDGVTPVPEPGTYAMLLGGLALLGAAARRRKT